MRTFRLESTGVDVTVEDGAVAEVYASSGLFTEVVDDAESAEEASGPEAEEEPKPRKKGSSK